MKRAAFSLVELSIVLVILGLLVGGILAGQSLIRAAELRAIGADFTKYQTALHTFRDKYFAIPGDMVNATSFWGAVNASGATCRSTASTGTLTCNGDGNGRITSMDGGVTESESFHAWVQLANAGLIEGNFSGVATSASILTTPGVNAPAGKIGKTAFFLNYITSWVPTPAQYRNLLTFGTSYPAVSVPYTNAITPPEAWNIDQKIDDGTPEGGKLIGIGSNAPWCASSTTYLLNVTERTCGFLYILQ